MSPSKVLLTGGSGFIASHVLDVLLQRGHTVVTTVRSQDKAKKIQANHPNAGDKLQFSIVEDIAQPNAFDKAVVSDPPFDAVIHTASPFHFNVTDTKKDLLDPAINGTNGVLKAIKTSAPSVKRVVITSSFAAIVDVVRKPANHTYSEADWNSVTAEEAEKDPSTGYRASKTFAEKAAWDFVEKEKPNFDVATINPPLVFGPIHPGLQTLDNLNTSNNNIYKFINGTHKKELPPTAILLWVDVRDLALAHVLAMEKKEAGGQRFFITAGYWTHKLLAEIIKKDFPEYADQLPADLSPGDFPAKDKMVGFDNARGKQVLGLEYISFEKSASDTIKSLKPLLAKQ